MAERYNAFENLLAFRRRIGAKCQRDWASFTQHVGLNQMYLSKILPFWLEESH